MEIVEKKSIVWVAEKLNDKSTPIRKSFRALERDGNHCRAISIDGDKSDKRRKLKIEFSRSEVVVRCSLSKAFYGNLIHVFVPFMTRLGTGS